MSIHILQPSKAEGVPASDRADQALMPISLSLVAVQIGGCAILLIGWLLGQERTTNAIFGNASMKANAAAALIVLGVAMLALVSAHPTRLRRRVGTGLAGAVVAIGMVTLSEYVLGWNLGIDQLLASDGTDTSGLPGRMAAETACLLTLMGVALIAIDRCTRGGRWPASYLVALVALVASLTLVGHAYGVPELYGVGSITGMAVPTAGSLLALTLAFACARPQRGLVKFLTARDAGGQVARSLIPSALVVPALFGAAVLAGERAGLYGPTTAVWLLCASVTVVGILLVIRTAVTVSSLDASRQASATALSHSESQWRAVLNTAQDAFVQADDRGRITGWNHQASNVTGWSREEAIGRSLVEMLVPERHRPSYLEALERALVDPSVAVGRREAKLLLRDGSEILVEAALSVVADGGGRRINAFMHDITERRRAEETLRASRDQLETVVSTMTEGLVCADRSGEFLLWNAAAKKIIGMGAGEVATTEWAGHFGLFAADGETLLPEKELPLVRALAGERIENCEIFVRNANLPDGAWIDVSAAPLIAPDGALDGAVAVFRDVTDRRRAVQRQRELRERLAQAERLETVGKLAGGIAHDFNNLLAVITTYSGFVANATEGAVTEDVEQIKAAAKQASDLTRQLIAFSRGEAVRPTVVELNGLIASSERLLRPLLGDKIALELSLDEAGAYVLADASQMEQILMNLATNARDAMPEGGLVTIRTEAMEPESGYASQEPGPVSGAHVRISFGDDGPGMPADVAKHAFEPFFTTKALGEGTGLGLATVYGVVAQSGGTIELRTEPNEGVNLTILLPAAPELATVAEDAAVPVIAGSDGKSVLVVEDERAVRAAACRILREHGYEVLEAADGIAALELLGARAGPLDLLLTDIRMEPMNGTELATEVVKLAPELRVVYMTGYTDNRDQLPTDRLLEKPFDADQLLLMVEQTLRVESHVDRDHSQKAA